MILEELAPAKINLTLAVLGKRPDGYHELDSIVAFANFGDHLQFVPGPELIVESSGTFASAIVDENLIHKVAQRARAVEPRLTLGRFRLEKSLPVAAGLGGGSSDAAAALRLLRQANRALAASIDWHAIATGTGADVPVCLNSRAARMQGLGEIVTPLLSWPAAIGCVLANPRLPLATVDVFRALRASALAPTDAIPTPDTLTSTAALIDCVRDGRNDLEAPAIELCPSIGEVKRALAALPGAEIARMSGSGPTCFALFGSAEEAAAAALALKAEHPQWWINAGTLH